MFIFPITSLAIVALMLIHHIDGFASMPKKQEKSNEAIKQFLEKEKENRAGVITDMPKFDPIMVNKAANNFDQLLFSAKLMRCPAMSKIVLKFYERLYDGKWMTDDEMKKMAQLMTFADDGKHLKAVEDEEVNAAVISLFNQHSRYFFEHVKDLYATDEQEEEKGEEQKEKEALPEKKH